MGGGWEEFSDRLWENKTKLINNMHNSLSHMCITGEAPDRAIEEISKQMGVSKAQAGRVVMTESAAFANKARTGLHGRTGCGAVRGC